MCCMLHGRRPVPVYTADKVNLASFDHYRKDCAPGTGRRAFYDIGTCRLSSTESEQGHISSLLPRAQGDWGTNLCWGAMASSSIQ